MNWQHFIKDYLTFTRKERIGLLVIVILIVGIWIIPTWLSLRKTSSASSDTSWVAAALKLQHPGKDSQDRLHGVVRDDNPTAVSHERVAIDITSDQLFYFDPNSASAAQWKKLGLRQKTISIIQNYLGKGGRFHEPDDLKKIYGIHPNEYTRLEPWIRIEKPARGTGEIRANDSKRSPATKTPNYEQVDINTGDTLAFIALPGIGSKLATRIINFREKLGGFFAIEQIAETFGLADSIFQRIKPHLKLGIVSLRKININAATKDDMKSHPYIRWNLANAIVEYRNQHGKFSSLEELKKLALMTDDAFNRIVPYLEL